MTGWKKNTPIPERELRDALVAAHDALTEVAMTKGLDPDGERARELCDAAVRKLDAGARRGRGRGHI
jgi:hypothetical protein